MAFFLVLLLWAGFTIIGELLRPKPKFGTPSPSSLGDFTLPTAQEGRAIPAAFGTVKIAGPNVVSFGDLIAQPIRQKVKTGLFSSKRITTGYRYYLGAQMVLCHGEIDAVLEVRFDDRPVGFTLATDYFVASEPSQPGWGVVGDSTVARVLDDPVTVNLVDAITDRDNTFIHGAENGMGAVIGARASHGSPHSNSFTGWKYHLWSRKDGSGTVSDELMDWYINSLWTSNPPTFVGGTVVKSLTNAIRDLLTTSYQKFTIDFTEAEAQQISAGVDFSILFRSNGFSGSVGTRQRITKALLEVPGSTLNEPLKLVFDSPTQFGGDEREGGVTGRMDVYRGTLTQTANDYLLLNLGPLPAYRGVSYAVLKQMYVGTTPYLKPMSFVVKRLPNTLGLASGRQDINGDANPAAILYEVLTNDRWGLALSGGFIDVESFRSAGNLLYAEGFGLSMIFDTAAQARDLVAEVLRHVDGVIYTDPLSGKLRLTLARDNYQPGDPFLVDVDMVESVKVSRPSWADTKNHVKVAYVDRSNNYAARVAQAQDLANIQVRGGEIAEETFEFRGISNATTAQKVAARELKTVSYPLAVVELVANRRAWMFRPGDLFRLNWPPLGIVNMACRVTRIGTGNLKDGRIRVDAVEDIFGVTGTAYLAPGATGWVDPIKAPVALGASALVEVPYALVVGPSRFVMTLGAQGAFPLLGYQVWTDPAGGTELALTADVREMTPTARLVRDMWYTDVEILVGSAVGLGILESITDADHAAGRNVMLVGNELVAWQLVTANPDGTYTLSNCVRGVADTTPAPHGIGDRAWFVTEGSGLTSTAAYESDVLLAAKLVPYTSVDVADLAGVSAVLLQTTSRALRPYVPTAVKVNALSYPAALQPYTDIAITWSHRNRLSEWSWALAGATGAFEIGTTYTLKFYGDDGLLKKTYSGLTGTSQTWTTEVADAGRRQELVRVTLEALVAGLGSFQVYDFTIYRSIVETPRLAQVPIGARHRRRATRVFRTAE